MRVWIDITNSPHVVIFRPLIARLQARGHEVTVTAREFAQTLGLLERFEIPHTVIGAHGGGGLGREGSGRGGTHVGARALRAPRALRPGGRARLDRPAGRRPAGRARRRSRCSTTSTRRRCITGTAAGRARAGARRDPGGGARALRHAPAEARALSRARRRSTTWPTTCPTRRSPASSDCDRTGSSRCCARRLRSRSTTAAAPRSCSRRRPGRVSLTVNLMFRLSCFRGPPSSARPCREATFIVPERPVDGPTLVQLADLVVSAGGTMNREAVALGVPAFTPFAGRLGAVDRRLIAEGRLHRIERADQVASSNRAIAAAAPPLRDPDVLLDAILARRRTTHRRP